jgi:hypothetical protein
MSGQVTDRAAVETSLFIGYIIIYGRLTNDQDRVAVDDFITSTASSAASASKKYADFLTIIASSLPRFSAEIRTARDGVRKIETLFACVHASSPK